MPIVSASEIEEAQTYRDVLGAWVHAKKKVGGGRALARLLGLSPPTVTRILAAKQTLSKDLLYKFCVANEMTFEQTGFVLALWDWESVETHELKARLAAELILHRKKLFSSKALTGEPDLAREAAVFVASRWEVDAVLSALSIPVLRNPNVLAQRLGLSVESVREILSTLERYGLVAQDKTGVFRNKRPHYNIDLESLGRVNIRSWLARAGSRPLVPNAKSKAHNYEAVSVVAISEEKAAKLKLALRRTFHEVLASKDSSEAPDRLYCYLLLGFDVCLED